MAGNGGPKQSTHMWKLALEMETLSKKQLGPWFRVKMVQNGF